MTTVYFVRHAQPDFSVSNDMIRPLTGEGQEDKRIVLDFLKDKNIDAFYSSPYKRSFDTIADAAKYFELSIQTDRRLRERDKGENGNKNHNMFRLRWADFNFRERGGESINMVQKRNIEALNEILESNRDKNIVIGTHGTALASIINYYDNTFNCDDFLRMIDWMPYIIELRFSGEQYAGRTEHVYVHKKFKW